jgi:hypothetical protein
MMLGGLPPMTSAATSSSGGSSSPSLNNGHPYSMMSFLHANGGSGSNGLGPILQNSISAEKNFG